MSSLFSEVRKLQTSLLDKALPELYERAQQLLPIERWEGRGRRAQAWLQLRFPDLYALGADGLARLGERVGAGNKQRGPHAEERALLHQLLHHADWNEREGAALGLARLVQLGRVAVGPELTEALALALRDNSAEVAAAAAEALGHVRDERAVAELRKVLENGDGYYSAITRAAAVVALASCLSEPQLGVVFAAIRDVQPAVSIAAIRAVTARAREAALFHLLPVLRDQSGFFAPAVRSAALNALRSVGNLSAPVKSELDGYAKQLKG